MKRWSVAYRMLGSLTEAEDAVQETWVRLNRSEPESIDNLAGWLTTVVSRVCLGVLRTRRSRPEEPMVGDEPESELAGPEEQAILAETASMTTSADSRACPTEATLAGELLAMLS